jgi:hypothetical protein
MDNAENISGQPAEKKPLGFERKLGITLAIILMVAAAAIGSKYLDNTPVVMTEPVRAVQPAQQAAPSTPPPFSAPQQ